MGGGGVEQDRNKLLGKTFPNCFCGAVTHSQAELRSNNTGKDKLKIKTKKVLMFSSFTHYERRDIVCRKDQIIDDRDCTF